MRKMLVIIVLMFLGRNVCLSGLVVSEVEPDATTSYWGKGGMFGEYDRNKEFVSERTLNSKTFDNKDGTFTAAIICGSVHYLNENDEWCEIDSKILQSKSGFYNKTNNFQTYFPANSGSNTGSKFTYLGKDLIYWKDAYLSWSDSSCSSISYFKPVISIYISNCRAYHHITAT